MVEYPSGLDVEWVAVDRKRRMGVFTTAGVGPIPRVYLASSAILEQVSAAAWSLPEIAEHDLFVALPRPDDFIAFARRGLHVFDWADAHRSEGQTGRYEVQARPKLRSTANSISWPAALSDALDQVTSRALDFDETAIDVMSALECAVEPAARRVIRRAGR